MSGADPVWDAARPLIDILAGDPTGDDLVTPVERLVHAAAVVLGVDGIGLMLLDDHDALRTVATSDDLASALEDVQVLHGDGPGPDSHEEGATIAVSDLGVDPRYREVGERLASAGVRAVLSSPVRAGVPASVIGNLNAALREPHVWSAEQVRANEAYAGLVGLALTLRSGAVDAGERARRLRVTLDRFGVPQDRTPDPDQNEPT